MKVLSTIDYSHSIPLTEEELNKIYNQMLFDYNWKPSQIIMSPELFKEISSYFVPADDQIEEIKITENQIQQLEWEF